MPLERVGEEAVRKTVAKLGARSVAMGLQFVNSAIQTGGISLFLIGLLATEGFLAPDKGRGSNVPWPPSIELGPQGVQFRHQF